MQAIKNYYDTFTEGWEMAENTFELFAHFSKNMPADMVKNYVAPGNTGPWTNVYMNCDTNIISDGDV